MLTIYDDNSATATMPSGGGSGIYTITTSTRPEGGLHVSVEYGDTYTARRRQWTYDAEDSDWPEDAIARLLDRLVGGDVPDYDWLAKWGRSEVDHLRARLEVVRQGRWWRAEVARTEAAKARLDEAIRAAHTSGATEVDLAAWSGANRTTVRRTLGK